MWPNWIDLIVVTIIWATSYSGFGRGFLAEFLNLISAVAITALTINLAGPAAGFLRPGLPLSPPLVIVLAFWGLFLMLWFVARAIRRRVADVIKWERFNWSIQGMGLLLGGLRGLWWAGFILLALSASGYSFLGESVNKKSVLAPRLLSSFRVSLEEASNRLPGARLKGNHPVPPLRPVTHGS